MIFRHFLPSDLDRIEVNAFGSKERVRPLLADYMWDMYTLLSDDIPLAIVVFAKFTREQYEILGREFNPHEYGGFCLISKYFTKKHCKKLASSIQMLVDKFGAKKVWTVSHPRPELEHWHHFLGFTKEDKPMVVEGQTCNVWSKTWA